MGSLAPALRVAALGVFGGLWLAVVVIGVGSRWSDLGIDYVFYRDVGARWLADGTYYLPRQLAGPYDVALMVDVLYPPAALLLFVPFAFLPAVLWWAVPLGFLGYCIHQWRPVPWALVAILALAAWPRVVGAVLFGNTDMWVAAGVAAGLRWGWPAALIALKPVFAPLALVGVRHHSAWVAAGVLLVVSLPLMGDYLTAMRNVRLDVWGYSAGSLVFALIPLVAYLGTMSPRVRTRGSSETVTSSDPERLPTVNEMVVEPGAWPMTAKKPSP